MVKSMDEGFFQMMTWFWVPTLRFKYTWLTKRTEGALWKSRHFQACSKTESICCQQMDPEKQHWEILPLLTRDTRSSPEQAHVIENPFSIWHWAGNLTQDSNKGLFTLRGMHWRQLKAQFSFEDGRQRDSERSSVLCANWKENHCIFLLLFRNDLDWVLFLFRRFD